MSLSGSQGLKSAGGGAASTLAPNATGVNLSLTGNSTALEFIATQTNSNVAFQTNTAGARTKLSSAVLDDYLTSDGVSNISVGAAVPTTTFTATMVALAPANSTQLKVKDSTNATSYFLILNNQLLTLFNNAVAAVMTWNGSNKQVGVAADISYSSFTDGGGTTGNQTLNVVRGVCAIAAAGTTCTITNSFISATSLVIPVLQTVDATAKSVVAVPSAGSVAFTLNGGSTGTVKIGFLVCN